MKKFLIIVSLSFLALAIHAENWKFESDLNLSLSQSAFSSNWVGTELSSITWLASSNSSLEKQLKDWLYCSNTLHLAFGQTHRQKTDDDGDRYWEKPEKSTDKIDFESLWRFTLQAWVDPYVAGRIETQFLDLSQEDMDNTRVINPILLTESAGVIRSFIDQEDARLTARMGAAFRQDVNRDEYVLNGAYYVQDTNTSIDGGAEFIVQMQKNIHTPLQSTLRSRLNIYQALLNSESDDLPNSNWKTADFVWENSITTKIYSIINASFMLEFRYDKEQDDDIQWKQMLGLGVSYNFF
ncbi:MAG: DUF3078 domain-containing protein [Candidatus Cloacimonetes bacterium]|nr:DUF3078 domain-containing protein [Candidatus Cloacimonadota bacterium]